MFKLSQSVLQLSSLCPFDTEKKMLKSCKCQSKSLKDENGNFFQIPLVLLFIILFDLMSSVRQNADYCFRFIRDAGSLHPCEAVCICGALLVAVVAQFWIYSSAVPQIGLSKLARFEEDP